jgi:hypothetical protein
VALLWMKFLRMDGVIGNKSVFPITFPCN